MCAVTGASKGLGLEQQHQQQHKEQQRVLQRAAAAHMQPPSASTELFLQLEAAAASESEQGLHASSLCQTMSAPNSASADTHADGQPASQSKRVPALSGSMPEAEALQLEIQQQEQKQQLLSWEEDVYAGLERGAGVQTASWPSAQPAAVYTMPPQQHAPTVEVCVPRTAEVALQQGDIASGSQLGLLGIAPQQGTSDHACQQKPMVSAPESRHRVQARYLSAAPTPKAAEAPLVKQGSYAVAAKQARYRSERQQKEVQQLAAQCGQMRAAAGHKQAAQV